MGEVWTADRPIRELPYQSLVDLFSEEAGDMHSELEKNKLTVELHPAPFPSFDSHSIRVAVSRNPEWYSELYHSHPYFRRDRSLRALGRIRDNEDKPLRYFTYDGSGLLGVRNAYDALFREIILDRLKDAYADPQRVEIMPVTGVTTRFFGSYSEGLCQIN